MNDRNYTTTVKCVSNRASIYICKAEEFYNMIKRDDKSWKILADETFDRDTKLISNIRKASVISIRNSKPKVEENQSDSESEEIKDES